MVDRHFVETMRLDLLRWLQETVQPTDGVEVLATVPPLSAGDAPEYAVVLWRDASRQPRVWTAWQYRDLWGAAEALRVLEARADSYELSRSRYPRFRQEGTGGTRPVDSGPHSRPPLGARRRASRGPRCLISPF